MWSFEIDLPPLAYTCVSMSKSSINESILGWEGVVVIWWLPYSLFVEYNNERISSISCFYNCVIFTWSFLSHDSGVNAKKLSQMGLFQDGILIITWFNSGFNLGSSLLLLLARQLSYDFFNSISINQFIRLSFIGNWNRFLMLTVI